MNNISKITIIASLMASVLSVSAQTPTFNGTFINLKGVAEDSAMKESTLITDIEKGANIKTVKLEDAKIKKVKTADGTAFNVDFGHNAKVPYVNIPISKDVRLDDWVSVALDITNRSDKQIFIEGQCFSDYDTSLILENGAYFYYRSMLVLEPGETDTMVIYLSRDMESMPSYMYDHFKGMFGLPGGFLRRKVNVDLSHFTHIKLFKQAPGEDWSISVKNIRAFGKYSLPSKELLENGFFPFIDNFGQYKYSDWNTKISKPEDMYAQKKAEDKDLAANPVSPEWDKFGGWSNGPQLKATGHFRVEKYEGKWWLVDPEGKLFWSQGICSIGLNQVTLTEEREKYFSYIPLNGDFYMSNLITKYQGVPTFATDVVNNVYDRLASWGFNTVAGGSITNLFDDEHRVPYTITLSSGIRDGLPNDFDVVAFKEAFRESLINGKSSSFAKAATDPWCIGFFVDNERGWPTENQKEIIYSYFKAVSEVLNELAPDKLYLGCRSNSVNFNRIAFEAGAEYCDVLSINHYDYNLSTFEETAGLDKPLIVGEYHFGSLDKGLAHTGLRTASSQKQRARIYKHFIEQALESDYIVGAHWFQYVDQCYTGRSDGENYQIGIVDICDRPHSEMVEASREIKNFMYHLRAGK